MRIPPSNISLESARIGFDNLVMDFVVPEGDCSHAIKKYNYGAFDIDWKVCKTNTVPKTAMRGPGQVQGSFIAEAVIEAVAGRLELQPEIVRERNFHDLSSLEKYFPKGSVGEPEGYTLPSIWARLKASARWEEREQEVEKFNQSNSWTKRGIAMIPIIYINPGASKSAMVSIFADGSIVIETAGVEIGQGLHTKVRQAACYALNKLFPPVSCQSVSFRPVSYAVASPHPVHCFRAENSTYRDSGLCKWTP